MTHANRVDPAGQLHAVEARGTLMGNRGILHDPERNIVKSHAHQNWVACALRFKDRRREIMAPRRYTELFFLDEATAFAAGHRPCAECRRKRYLEFTRAWRDVHGGPAPGRSLPQTIDRTLHAARIDRQRRKITHHAPVGSLPPGTIFRDGQALVLVAQERHLEWSFEGYRARDRITKQHAAVLTPLPLLDLFRSGFVPFMHASHLA